jgi:predicted MPP superfamily phosphohydrolase
MLALFPYHATAAGAHFRVQGTLLAHRGLSADTSVGNWTFPHVDALPFGVHITPVNLDLVRISAAASAHPQKYAAALRHDLVHQLPQITAWLAGSIVIGALLGLAVDAAIELAGRQLRGEPHRPDEISRGLRGLAGAGIVAVLIADVGVVTYHSDWSHRSQVSGTLAALQLFPNQLNAYYGQHSKPVDVLTGIAAIQNSLQHRISHNSVPPTSYNVMFISDMHLAGTYSLVQQYAANFDVKLIVNTGDEAEFGTRAEMTPAYVRQIRSVASVTPMIWLAGNHDSPTTVSVMRSIPGVHVLGTKQATGSTGYAVTGQALDALGLSIAAVPDPRVYGGPGAFGSNDTSVVGTLETHTIDAAVDDVPSDERFDIFATHEPVAASEAVKDLPGQIRQTNAGHLHAQNPDQDIQRGSPITLIEGSTGAGGLDQLNRGTPPPPIEFSIESVAADCQFTRVDRFRITSAAPSRPTEVAAGALPQVTTTTHYFSPQDVATGRTCSPSEGISSARAL